MSQKEAKQMPEFDENLFRERFIELREDYDMKQAEFAEFLGIPTGSVGGYESGKKFPNGKTLFKISKKCNISVDYLIGISGVKSPDVEIEFICDYIGLSERAINELHYRLEEKRAVDNDETIKMIKNSPCYGRKYRENVSKCTIFDVLNNFFEVNTIELPNFFGVLEYSADYVNGLKELSARVEKLIEKYNPDLLVDSNGKINEEAISEFADERYSILHFEYPGIRNNIFEAADELKKIIEKYAKEVKENIDEQLDYIFMALSPIGLADDIQNKIDRIKKEVETDGKHN